MQTYQPASAITFLKTRDLDATSAFYTGVMGFPLALDQGACRIFRVRPGSYIGFCRTDGGTGSDAATMVDAAILKDAVILTFEIEDVDGYCRYLQGCGVAIEIPPRLNSTYNIYQMFVRDPNGYQIEIQRFLDPAWEAQKSG